MWAPRFNYILAQFHDEQKNPVHRWAGDPVPSRKPNWKHLRTEQSQWALLLPLGPKKKRNSYLDPNWYRARYNYSNPKWYMMNGGDFSKASIYISASIGSSLSTWLLGFLSLFPFQAAGELLLSPLLPFYFPFRYGFGFDLIWFTTRSYDPVVWLRVRI